MDKRRVMIVDDEEDFLIITKLNLESTGKYEVLTLSKAKEIIPRVHSFRPNIILLDMLMPETGGMDVCEILNSDPIGNKTPIIILTALYKDADRLKISGMNVADYVTKPIEKNELIARIEKAIELSQDE